MAILIILGARRGAAPRNLAATHKITVGSESPRANSGLWVKVKNINYVTLKLGDPGSIADGVDPPPPLGQMVRLKLGGFLPTTLTLLMKAWRTILIW